MAKSRCGNSVSRGCLFGIMAEWHTPYVKLMWLSWIVLSWHSHRPVCFCWSWRKSQIENTKTWLWGSACFVPLRCGVFRVEIYYYQYNTEIHGKILHIDVVYRGCGSLGSLVHWYEGYGAFSWEIDPAWRFTFFDRNYKSSRAHLNCPLVQFVFFKHGRPFESACVVGS